MTANAQAKRATVGEPACRPGSVRPLARGGGHPSGTAVAGSLVRSTREHRAGRPQSLAQGAAGSPLDLAPGGVYRAAAVTCGAGGLLHHRFTLTPTSDAGAVCFLWHCPAGHPGSALPTTLPCGARTFLTGLAPGATARPTHPCSGYAERRPSGCRRGPGPCQQDDDLPAVAGQAGPGQGGGGQLRGRTGAKFGRHGQPARRPDDGDAGDARPPDRRVPGHDVRPHPRHAHRPRAGRRAAVTPGERLLGRPAHHPAGRRTWRGDGRGAGGTGQHRARGDRGPAVPADKLLAENADLVRGRGAIEQFWREAISRARAASAVRTISLHEVTSSGDLGYALGTVVVRIPPGRELTTKFATVWQRDADGRWRLAVDSSSPNPLAT